MGIAAAAGVYVIWSTADPAGSILVYKAPTDFIVWWGTALDAGAFLLLSLAIFTGWTLVGCYREMRLELKVRNRPYVWLGFLVFIGIYVAGFDAWLGHNNLLTHLDAVARRLLLAGTAFAALAYLMVFLEPKDRVHLRWLASAFVRFRLGAAFGGLQAWMLAWLAALIAGIVLVVWLGQLAAPADQAMVGAMLGFLTRDMAIVVFANAMARRRGGDFAAVAVLFALYVLLPAIVNGLSYGNALVLFFPQASTPVWLSPAVAWGEAMLAVAFAVSRVALSDRKQSA